MKHIQSVVLSGDLLPEALLSADDVSGLNRARSEFDKLEDLVCQLIIPAFGSKSHPEAQQVFAALEHVRMFSGNFCWRHRHVGKGSESMDVVLPEISAQILVQGGVQ